MHLPKVHMRGWMVRLSKLDKRVWLSTGTFLAVYYSLHASISHWILPTKIMEDSKYGKKSFAVMACNKRELKYIMILTGTCCNYENV
jgi:hypothetical protein